MKTLLFVGGTSFFGKQAVNQLIESDQYEITLLTRGNNIPEGFKKHVTFIQCDRTNLSALSDALRNKYFDVVVDNIAYTGEDVKNLLTVLEGTVQHYLLCSTALVYPEWHVNHSWLENEAVIDYVPGQDSYANGKRAAEQTLLEFKYVPYSIYRPTVVQGPADPIHRVDCFIDHIRKQKKFFIPDDVKLQHVYSADVAQAIVKLIELDPSNHAYNVCGDDMISLEQYCRTIAELLNQPPCHEVMPRKEFMKSFVDEFPSVYEDTLLLSNSLLKAKAHYQPTTIANWLPATINWYKEQFK